MNFERWNTGGKYTVTVKTDEKNNRAYQLGVSHSSPRPASIFCIAADFEGNPLGTINLSWNPGLADQGPTQFNFIQVFLASDIEQNFGHECPRCKGYWRSPAVPHLWNPKCPYCGLSTGSHNFLTEGQRRFVKKCCQQVLEALEAEEDGEYVIDMDAIADEIQKGAKPPAFYYAEKTQQQKFKCSLCGIFNDILGKYGYCSSCGYRNNLDLFADDLKNLKSRLEEGTISPREFVKNVVSDLDSAGSDYMEELIRHVPMAPTRRKKTKRIKFHDFEKLPENLEAFFDIQVKAGLNKKDFIFLKKMFQRRHVFEHKGGVADESYLKRSGDTDVKLGQAIRESRKNAERFGELLLVVAKNLHEGFHSILPVNGEAIKILQPDKIAKKTK